MNAQEFKALYGPKLLRLVAKIWFGSVERQKLWEMLAAHQRYNLALKRSLELYRERLIQRNSPLELVMDEVIAAYQDGQDLDEAFSSFIPPEEAMLLRAGSQTDLSRALELCVDMIKARRSIMSSLVSALAYPLLLLVMFCGMLWVLAFMVFPELRLLGEPSQWGMAARILFGSAEFIASPWGALLAALLLLGVVTSMLSLPLWTGSLRLKAEKYAPWSIYRLLNGATWMMSVATLMRAGMKFIFILDDMLELEQMSPWLRERVQRIRQVYQHGDRLASALKAAGMNFPSPEVIEDLLAYEELPSFYDNFYNIAREWLETSQKEITRKAGALNAALICGIGLLLCGVALATSSLQQSINIGGL